MVVIKRMKKTVICIIILICVVAGAFYLPEAVLRLQDQRLSAEYRYAHRSSIDYVVSKDYEMDRKARLEAFAKGCGEGKDYKLTVSSESGEQVTDAMLQKLLLTDDAYMVLMLYGDMMGRDMYSMLSTEYLKEQQYYIIYNEDIVNGAAFLCWYLEFQLDGTGTITLLADAKDYTIYYVGIYDEYTESLNKIREDVYDAGRKEGKSDQAVDEEIRKKITKMEISSFPMEQVWSELYANLIMTLDPELDSINADLETYIEMEYSGEDSGISDSRNPASLESTQGSLAESEKLDAIQNECRMGTWMAADSTGMQQTKQAALLLTGVEAEWNENVISSDGYGMDEDEISVHVIRGEKVVTSLPYENGRLHCFISMLKDAKEDSGGCAFRGIGVGLKELEELLPDGG